MRFLSDTGYTKGTKLKDDEGTIYLVENSIDWHWWTKKEENKGKWLTQVKIIGKIDLTQQTEEENGKTH